MSGELSCVLQPKKSPQKIKIAAEPAVINALKSEPDVFLSISFMKLGKDPEAAANPYTTDDGQKFDHIFDYLLNGKKTMRAVWTPGLTQNMFDRTVNIDYALLAERCNQLGKKFENAVSATVTSPAGTNLTVPLENRKALFDNGDFSKPGSGGNIPAGEVFISPVVGNPLQDGTGCNGTIVYDGSMTFGDGDSIISTPINVTVKNGFVTSVKGKQEAKRLLNTIQEAENKAVKMEKEGKLPKGQGEITKKVNEKTTTFISQLNLIDLAGSENASKTCCVGLRFKEGANINKSLLALSNVINSLSQKQFVNYRDSKLTRLLQPALGGNSKTAIICTITDDIRIMTIHTAKGLQAKNVFIPFCDWKLDEK